MAQNIEYGKLSSGLIMKTGPEANKSLRRAQRRPGTGDVVTVDQDTKEMSIRNQGSSFAGPGSCSVRSVELKVISRKYVSR